MNTTLSNMTQALSSPLPPSYHPTDIRILRPWLPSICLASAMMLFLVISFVMYHFRFVRKRRAALDYIIDHDDVTRRGSGLSMLHGSFNNVLYGTEEDNVNFELKEQSENFSHLERCSELCTECSGTSDVHRVSSRHNHEHGGEFFTKVVENNQENWILRTPEPARNQVEKHSSHQCEDCHAASNRTNEHTATAEIHIPTAEAQRHLHTHFLEKSQHNPSHEQYTNRLGSYDDSSLRAIQTSDHRIRQQQGNAQSLTDINGLVFGQQEPLCVVCLVTHAKLRPVGICSSCSNLKQSRTSLSDLMHLDEHILRYEPNMSMLSNESSQSQEKERSASDGERCMEVSSASPGMADPTPRDSQNLCRFHSSFQDPLTRDTSTPLSTCEENARDTAPENVNANVSAETGGNREVSGFARVRPQAVRETFGEESSEDRRTQRSSLAMLSQHSSDLPILITTSDVSDTGADSQFSNAAFSADLFNGLPDTDSLCTNVTTIDEGSTGFWPGDNDGIDLNDEDSTDESTVVNEETYDTSF